MVVKILHLEKKHLIYIDFRRESAERRVCARLCVCVCVCVYVCVCVCVCVCV
jgi:hypothetical protein